MAGLLEGQKALVTGASSGIGRACALAMARAGAAVAVNYFGSAEDAEAVAAEIAAEGGEAFTVRADVSDEAAVDAMFARTVDSFGTVDIVVANAGVQSDAGIAEMTLEQWQRVLAINLQGQFLCARAAVRAFRRRGMQPGAKALGKILCMSSVHEVIPWAGRVNYAASKGGVMLMMKSLAQEVAPERIRVVGIAPGAIRTAINESAWKDDAALRELLRLIPYGRLGEPDDIAKAAVWLASDEADYVTGTTLYVDGGMMLYPAFRENG